MTALPSFHEQLEIKDVWVDSYTGGHAIYARISIQVSLSSVVSLKVYVGIIGKLYVTGFDENCSSDVGGLLQWAAWLAANEPGVIALLKEEYTRNLPSGAFSRGNQL